MYLDIRAKEYHDHTRCTCTAFLNKRMSPSLFELFQRKTIAGFRLKCTYNEVFCPRGRVSIARSLFEGGRLYGFGPEVAPNRSN